MRLPVNSSGYFYKEIAAQKMMTNRPSDILFQLIHSLEKAEKRHFKLYIRRSSSNENLKIVQLFDAIEKMRAYDEQDLLKRLPQVQKTQLHNLKKHLYKQILSSLRLLKSADSVDLQLNEQFDHAHILYKKGLFYQSLRLLEKAKQTAKTHQKFSHLNQVLSLEKRIHTQYSTKQIQEKAAAVSKESAQVSRHLELVTRLSNLALQLYSWHIKQGPVGTAAEAAALDQLFQSNLPNTPPAIWGFYEQLYLYQSYTWYALLRHDHLRGYRYAVQWVRLFQQNPNMQRVETSHYIKGLHYLLNVHFELFNYPSFLETLSELEAFAQTERVQQNDNFRIQAFIYLAQARLNLHFLQGTLQEAKPLVAQIEATLKENEVFIDAHRTLVLHYKTGLLYFALRDYGTSIDYLQKIINDTSDLRHDLQVATRMLHLLAHFEEGNLDLMDYLTRSTERFIARLRPLSEIEKKLFLILRQAPAAGNASLRQQLAALLQKQNKSRRNPVAGRQTPDPYLALWLESKVRQQTIQALMQERFQQQTKPKQQPPSLYDTASKSEKQDWG